VATSTPSVVSWGSLGVALILVGITAWYASLTRKIAGSSLRAAEAAQAAAASSEKAAAAAVAELSVQFEVNQYEMFPVTLSGTGPRRLGITIVGRGASVFVHSAELKNVLRRSRFGSSATSVGLHKVQLETGSNERLPVLLHAGESVSFLVPEALSAPRYRARRSIRAIWQGPRQAADPNWPTIGGRLSIEALVYYSLTKDSEIIPRLVSNDRYTS
jgi:hypothetical protein